jgi:hypothetical protein
MTRSGQLPPEITSAFFSAASGREAQAATPDPAAYVTEVWCPSADDGIQRLHSPIPEPEPERGPDPDPEVEAARLAYTDAVADRDAATPATVWIAEQATADAWDAYQDAWNDRHGPDAEADFAASITDPEPEPEL